MSGVQWLLRTATSFRFLRAFSFAHSAVFAALLYVAIAGDRPEIRVLGWAHGVLWITMSVLVLISARRREIPYWLAVAVAVVGGLGPFAGSIGFVVAQRRGRRVAI